MHDSDVTHRKCLGSQIMCLHNNAGSKSPSLCNAKQWYRVILRLDFTWVFKNSMAICEVDEEESPTERKQINEEKYWRIKLWHCIRSQDNNKRTVRKKAFRINRSDCGSLWWKQSGFVGQVGKTSSKGNSCEIISLYTLQASFSHVSYCSLSIKGFKWMLSQASVDTKQTP